LYTGTDKTEGGGGTALYPFLCPLVELKEMKNPLEEERGGSLANIRTETIYGMGTYSTIECSDLVNF